MENNRMLLISMAGTRKTKHWPRMELTWAEFVEKLKLRKSETGRIKRCRRVRRRHICW